MPSRKTKTAARNPLDAKVSLFRYVAPQHDRPAEIQHQETTAAAAHLMLSDDCWDTSREAAIDRVYDRFVEQATAAFTDTIHQIAEARTKAKAVFA